MKSDHVCRAEAAPDVWQANDPDPLVGTECMCCGLTPEAHKAAVKAAPKFSKRTIQPDLHVHRGQRGGPVLKSVQCDECGDMDFAMRCRQCGALYKEMATGAACGNCDRLSKEALAGGILISDWEQVLP